MNQNTLEALIAERILREGPMRLDSFLELCVYHPELGYYSLMDSRRDFVTVAQRSFLFRECVAAHLAEAPERFGWNEPVFVELGAGDGEFLATLCEKVAACGWENQVFFVEMGWAAPGARKRAPGAAPLPSLATLPARREVIIFANEFFDAFMPRLFALENASLSEAYVAIDTTSDSRFVLTFEPVRLPDAVRDQLLLHDLETLIRAIETTASERSSAFFFEFQESLASYCEIFSQFESAYMLAFDYGNTMSEIENYPRGTLMAYARHVATEDVLADCGARDVTCHVNLSLLETWLERAGFSEQARASQSFWLLEHGLLEFVEAAAYNRKREALNDFKSLVIPGTMSETFTALEAWKGCNRS